MTTLAELRQASLKEQKQKEQKPTAAETAPATPAPIIAETPVAPPPATPEPAKPTPATRLTVVDETSAPSPAAVREGEFFARLHETLSHKTLHPSGAKVSADMSPALFHRAKRYCLDHGNITLRQVLVDLLTAYLEEEGY